MNTTFIINEYVYEYSFTSCIYCIQMQPVVTIIIIIIQV